MLSLRGLLMTKVPSQKTCFAYGPMKSCSLRRRRMMTMTKIPSRQTSYTYHRRPNCLTSVEVSSHYSHGAGPSLKSFGNNFVAHGMVMIISKLLFSDTETWNFCFCFVPVLAGAHLCNFFATSGLYDFVENRQTHSYR